MQTERSKVQATPRVPWMCGYSLPRTALSLASPCAAHRRGDSWYGLLVNRHVRPKISGPCTCSTSFSKSRSQHTFAKSTWVSSVATPTAVHGAPMSGQTKSWLCVAVRVRTMYSSKICRRLLCVGCSNKTVVINEQQYSVGTQGIHSGGQYSFDLYCKLYYIKEIRWDATAQH